jgi:hypothetical protein
MSIAIEQSSLLVTETPDFLSMANELPRDAKWLITQSKPEFKRVATIGAAINQLEGLRAILKEEMSRLVPMIGGQGSVATLERIKSMTHILLIISVNLPNWK